MPSRVCGWIIVIAAMLWMAPASWAQDYSQAAPPPDRVDEALSRYNLHPALEKLGRGGSNLIFGFLEIPLNIYQRYSVSDTVGSWLTGLRYGVIKGVVRTAVGAYEVVSSPLPYPEDFAPILPTLEDFRKDKRREPLPFE